MSTQLPQGYVWAETLLRPHRDEEQQEFPRDVNPVTTFVVDMRRPDDWEELTNEEKRQRKRQALIGSFDERYFHFEGISRVTTHHRVFVPSDGIFAYFEVISSDTAYSQLRYTQSWLETICSWTPERYRAELLREIDLAKEDCRIGLPLRTPICGLRIQDHIRKSEKMATTSPDKSPKVETPEPAPLSSHPLTDVISPAQPPRAIPRDPRTVQQELGGLFDEKRFPMDKAQINGFMEQADKLSGAIYMFMCRVFAKLLFIEAAVVFETPYINAEIFRNIALIFGALTFNHHSNCIVLIRKILMTHVKDVILPFVVRLNPNQFDEIHHAGARLRYRSRFFTYLWMNVAIFCHCLSEFVIKGENLFFSLNCESYFAKLHAQGKAMIEGRMQRKTIIDYRIYLAQWLATQIIRRKLDQRFFEVYPAQAALVAWRMLRPNKFKICQIRVADRTESLEIYYLEQLRTRLMHSQLKRVMEASTLQGTAAQPVDQPLSTEHLGGGNRVTIFDTQRKMCKHLQGQAPAMFQTHLANLQAYLLEEQARKRSGSTPRPPPASVLGFGALQGRTPALATNPLLPSSRAATAILASPLFTLQASSINADHDQPATTTAPTSSTTTQTADAREETSAATSSATSTIPAAVETEE